MRNEALHDLTLNKMILASWVEKVVCSERKINTCWINWKIALKIAKSVLLGYTNGHTK
jgi:hypothetical protein